MVSERTAVNEVFLSDLDLAKRYGVARVTPWRWAKSKGFPQPIRLGENCTRWKLSEVEAWENSRGRHESGGGSNPKAKGGES